MGKDICKSLDASCSKCLECGMVVLQATGPPLVRKQAHCEYLILY